MCKRESYPTGHAGDAPRLEKERIDAHVRVHRAGRGVRYLEEIFSAEGGMLPIRICNEINIFVHFAADPFLFTKQGRDIEKP